MTAVQSVERSLHLLREIAEEPGRLVELADRVNLPTSTTARLLATLETNNAIERNSDGVYRIGGLIKTMGRVAEPGINLETAAQPHLPLTSPANSTKQPASPYSLAVTPSPPNK